MTLRKHHVDLFGNAAQASADQNAGEVQQHFQIRIVAALTLHQLRDVGDFRVVKHQQGFAGNTAANKALADGRELFRAAGIVQRHMQLTDLKDVQDRKSVVSGKSVSVRVDLGGSRIIKKKKTNQ